MPQYYYSDRVYAGGAFGPATLEVEGERIVRVLPGLRDKGQDLRGYILLPGYIDSHIHGCMGADTVDGTYEALDTMSQYLASHGVTSFVPTTMTMPVEGIKEAVLSVKAASEKGVTGARILGANIEGPYISAKYRGAHPEEYIREIDLNELRDLVESTGETIRTFTVAPEKENAYQAIAYLRGKGIRVSIGHSAATEGETRDAVCCGATTAVHLFNGMVPFHHRQAGIIGEVLLNNEIYAELICDGIHVCQGAIQLAARCKGPDRIILITDCMRAGGMPDGRYKLGEMEVNVENGVARTLQNGSLAGSTLSMDLAVKKYIQMAGVKTEDAVRAATENPAKAIGEFNRIGSLAPGKLADFIAVNQDMQVVLTVVGGKAVYSRMR